MDTKQHQTPAAGIELEQRTQKGEKNVFKKFNWLFYGSECKHAEQLIGSHMDEDGSMKQLDEPALSQPPEDFECNRLGQRAQELWEAELKRHGHEGASLAKVLFRCLRWDYLLFLVETLIVKIFLILLVLESLRRMLTVIGEYDKALGVDTSLTEGDMLTCNSSVESGDLLLSIIDSSHLDELYSNIIIHMFVILLSLLMYAILTAINWTNSLKLGLKCRIILTQLIREKSLRIHLSSSISESGNGTISLIANEVTSIDEANKWLIYVVIGPCSLISTCVWLALTQTGWQPILATIPFLALSIGVSIYLPTISRKIMRKKQADTNKRTEIINTAIMSIKIVKMFAWESLFLRKVSQYRGSNMKHDKNLDKFSFADDAMMFANCKILPVVLLIGSIMKMEKLNVSILFIASSTFNLWRRDSSLYFSKGLRTLSDISVAIESIRRYLLQREFDDQRSVGVGDKPMIRCQGLEVSMGDTESKDSSAFFISGLDMELELGDLVFIVGPVGCGKSSLLLTLLGETRITNGRLTYTQGSRFAYASQEACLFPDTVRNNIINGRKFDGVRYNKVLDVCALRPDLKQLPHADQTLVGSRGVALSGGQKARLSLARAVYSQADIYLLDDPLSALDAKVAREILANCICGFLAGKLVVLATHQTQFLDSANKLVILSRDERPIFGHRKELQHREEFRTMLEKLAKPPAATTVCQQTLLHPSNRGATSHSESSTSDRTNRKLRATRASSYGLILALGFSRVETLRVVLVSILTLLSAFYSEYYIRIWSREIVLMHSQPEEDRSRLIAEWAILLVVVIAAVLVKFYSMVLFGNGVRRAILRLHDQMVDCLFNAKMIFFDFCHSGDLSSRYSSDFALIDQSLVFCSTILTQIALSLTACIIALCLMYPVLTIIYIPFVVILFPLSRGKFNKSRLLKSCSNNMRSPVHTEIATTIEHLSTIRSEPDYLLQTKNQFALHLDRLTSMSLLSEYYQTQLSINLRIGISLMYAMLYCYVFLVEWAEINLPDTGTFLMISLNSFNFAPALVEFFFYLDSTMMSVEGVKTLTELEPEHPSAGSHNSIDSPPQAEPPKLRWTNGQIVLDGVTMRYFEGERAALEALSLTIEAGERVGVVGRTGAGKSTIVSALYRLYPFEGRILIDGVDTKSLGLAELRASLGVIPQDPVLFSDSLRTNLDPVGQFEDSELWRALEVVSLRRLVAESSPLGLDQQISEGGRNFSLGQRQLICLARALLRSPKILLIDEATASVDSETDALIQRTIRAHFASSTIIAIAHRLDTVLDYDRILVLDAGRMVEFDTVANLLELDDGLFRGMLEAAGSESVDTGEKCG